MKAYMTVHRAMFRFVFIVGVFLLYANRLAECTELNTLQMNRLFTKTHLDRMNNMAQSAAPGAHNHELLGLGGGSSGFAIPMANVAPNNGLSNSFQPINQINAAPPRTPNPTATTQQNLMNTFLKSSPNAVAINSVASSGIQMVSNLMSDPRFANASNLMNQVSSFQAPPKFCPFKKTITCDISFPYRTFDGTCNNLKNLWWGQAETPYKRWLSPDYSDQFKLNEPRVAADGSELPNPRDIACKLHSDQYEIEPLITHIFMQWGQFVNHELTSLSITRAEDGSSGICNKCIRTEKCIPIPINPNIQCGQQINRPCIEFIRSSATFPDVQCSLGAREQLNLQTAYIDGSQVYGTSAQVAMSLRDLSRGKGLMLVQSRPSAADLMPADRTPKPADCLDFAEDKRCFRAGDDRVNQNPGLMVMHTVFLREHNRIANILSQINPQWSDETVFQETRRVIIAFIQHIMYNEYLPILLGNRNIEAFNLAPNVGTAYFTGYDETVDPRINNEYASSVGRFGHSMIRSEYSRLNNKYEKAGTTSFMLRNSYFRANHIYDECQGGLESIARGLLKDPIMKVDRWMSSDLTQHLFETRDDLGRPFHFDLATINIERGRDHGIPGYTKWRSFCGLRPINNWEDMKQFISEDIVNIFRQLYTSVDDVDLYPAGLNEFKEHGSIVGPTFGCLLGRQFRDLKFGDRFWYETNQSPGSFTQGQLFELRKITLGKVLCRNLVDTPQIQPLAFISSKLEGNELTNCQNLPDIDWSHWRTQ